MLTCDYWFYAVFTWQSQISINAIKYIRINIAVHLSELNVRQWSGRRGSIPSHVIPKT